MKNHYLVPLDGSPLGEHALPWARALSHRTGRPVELIRCYESLANLYMLPEFASPGVTSLDEGAVTEQLDEYLAEQARKFPADKVATARYEGDPASVILERGKLSEVEAVVMASHGRGGLGRWLLGSVATKVVRGSQFPVLVVNASAQVDENPSPKRILVPLDGSRVAEVALEEGAKLARIFDAELLIYQGITFTPIGHPHLDAAVALELQNAREYLEELKTRFPDINVRVEAKIAGVSTGILEKAADCDLVVMSSHGRSGVKRWLLGSVAERILQEIDKPLMVVYGGGAED